MREHPYRFDLGNAVHFGRGGRYDEARWRGWLVIGKSRQQHRRDVYRLVSDTRDCYGADQRWGIGRYPFLKKGPGQRSGLFAWDVNLTHTQGF